MPSGGLSPSDVAGYNSPTRLLPATPPHHSSPPSSMMLGAPTAVKAQIEAAMLPTHILHVVFACQNHPWTDCKQSYADTRPRVPLSSFQSRLAKAAQASWLLEAGTHPISAQAKLMAVPLSGHVPALGPSGAISVKGHGRERGRRPQPRRGKPVDSQTVRGSHNSRRSTLTSEMSPYKLRATGVPIIRCKTCALLTAFYSLSL